MNIITEAARNAGLVLAQYVAGYGLVVSAEEADNAAKQLFVELDKIETLLRAATKHHATGLVVGFALGALLVLQAFVVGQGGHP